VIVQKADQLSRPANSNNSAAGNAAVVPAPVTDPNIPATTPTIPAGQIQESQLKTQLGEIREATNAALQDVALPIQWTPVNLSQQLDCQPSSSSTSWEQFRQDCNLGKVIQKNPFSIPRLLLGWLISGLAIAMGAPFWFDLLSKIMNVRNTGNRPASTTDQQNANPPR
jgi:hypothetical protein